MCEGMDATAVTIVQESGQDVFAGSVIAAGLPGE